MKLHLWIGQRATRSVPSVTAALLSPCPALRRVLSRSRPCPPSDSDNRDASRAGPVHHSDSDAPTRGCGWAPSPFPRWARALPSVRRRQPTGGEASQMHRHGAPSSALRAVDGDTRGGSQGRIISPAESTGMQETTSDTRTYFQLAFAVFFPCAYPTSYIILKLSTPESASAGIV